MRSTIVCSKCSSRLKLNNSQLGRNVKCPRCKLIFRVSDHEPEATSKHNLQSQLSQKLIIAGAVASLAFISLLIVMFYSRTRMHEEPNDKIAAANPAPKQQQNAIPVRLAPINPEPPKIEDRPKPPEPQPEPVAEPFEFKGAKLGMSLLDFKTKFHRKYEAGKAYVIPWTSDERKEIEREKEPNTFLAEESWHIKARITNARLSYPFEDRKKSEFTPTLAGIRTDGHVFGFIDEQLYLILFQFPQSGFETVTEAMIAKYGKPSRTSTRSYQNGFGVVFVGSVIMWENGSSTISLIEHVGDAKTSTLIFVHDKLQETAKSREEQFGKPKL
jgi:predicted Zn finger-like uncharacterized protein